MVNKKKLGLGVLLVLVVAAFLGVDLNQEQSKSTQNQVSTAPSEQREHNQKSVGGEQLVQQASAPERNDSAVIQKAFEQQQSGIQVLAEGRVKAILRDDNQGSRHQKFILSLDNGLTVLVAHNIDLAPRIENLHKGDVVEFYGEYEFSQQGGVIHWTHRDPQNRHASGWLKHQGKVYQ